MTQNETPEAEPSFWPTSGSNKARPTVPTGRSRPSAAKKQAVVRVTSLCEPLFQYVCRLNRSARQQRAVDPGQVRSELKSMLAEAQVAAASAGAPPGGPSLPDQWRSIEPVMLFFVDFTIRSSALTFAGRWDDLARELKGELSGDEKFFDLLEDALKDHTDAGADRVAVFYKCLGLGFTGFYLGQPEYLRRKMLDCSTHIRAQIDADGTAKICPDAYEHVNTADLIETPGKSVVGVVIALVGLVIVIFVIGFVVYKNDVSDLKKSVDGINTAPVNTAPVKTAPVKTAPVKTDPVKTDPVETAPAEQASPTTTPASS